MTRTKPEVNQQPLFLCPVAAGFPGVADDFVEQSLDLNEYLIKRPASTFFVRVTGTSMIKAGIMPGDLLVVDKSATPHDNSVVIATIDGEFTVKRLSRNKNNTALLPENPNFKPIPIQEGDDVSIWGVVIHVIHSFEQKL